MSKCDKTYQEPTAYTFISNYFLCFVSHCVSLFYRVNVESSLFSVASSASVFSSSVWRAAVIAAAAACAATAVAASAPRNPQKKT